MAVPLEENSKDPYLGMRFWVAIDGIQVAGFSECSAITVETEVFEYAEGGLNTYTHKLPVRTKYGNITLKRGLDPGHDLYSWYLSTLDGSATRKNITISVYPFIKDHKPNESIGDPTPVEQWLLYRAFPVKWTGPDLKAETGTIAVETLEFAHEGILNDKNEMPKSSGAQGV